MKGSTQGTCTAGMNLSEGLRFPHNRALLPLSYAKIQSFRIDRGNITDMDPEHWENVKVDPGGGCHRRRCESRAVRGKESLNHLVWKFSGNPMCEFQSR